MKVRVGQCVIDARARQIVCAGEERRLSPKAFDLLMVLIEQRPAVLDKALLRERLWPGVHVVDASLSNLVAEVRRVLDETIAPQLIRTVHGVGYACGTHVESAEGAPAARFWIVWNDRPLRLNEGQNIVGRDASCAIWVDADGVSRRHARVQVPAAGDRGDVTIDDLGSTNGTFVEGRRLTGVRTLTHGDKVRLGEATVTFRAGREADTPTKRVRSPRR